MKSNRITFLALCALCFAGCSETPEDGATGRLDVRLTASGDIREVTRVGLGLVLPPSDDFSLAVSTPKGLVYQCDRLAEYDTEKSYLPGTYTASVAWGSVAAEGFDTPAFKGDKAFTIERRQTATVAIEATVANAVVVMEYTDAFLGYFTDFALKLTTDRKNAFDFPKTETRHLYIDPAGGFVLAGTATTTAGKAVTIPEQRFGALAPRTLYHVRFDVNGGQMGTGSITITFNDEPYGEVDLDVETNPDAPDR